MLNHVRLLKLVNSARKFRLQKVYSRFRNPKQQKEILQRAESGKIDVLIGTHRILSKDLKFADLGLLTRFGSGVSALSRLVVEALIAAAACYAIVSLGRQPFAT